MVLPQGRRKRVRKKFVEKIEMLYIQPARGGGFEVDNMKDEVSLTHAV